VKVPLQDWAEMHYKPAPSAWVLRKWVREGEIYPPPEKVGVSYYVETHAKRINAQRPTLLDRLMAE
jgi:predicted site-specific integrase-resolvase